MIQIKVSTRFGDVSQVHRVGHPGGARQQITFFDEPVGGLQRQPGGSRMIFTMDAGGSEFSQIFLLDPAGNDDAVMLTDGKSRNGSVVWDRTGEWIAYQSTRRNGASNDVWLMDVSNSETARIALTSPDGTYWAASDFSPDNRKLLIINYVGNADSRIHLLDIETGKLRLLAGDPDNPSSNFPFAFDHEGTGFWYITDVKGDFRQMAWQSLEKGSKPVILTADIPWNVEGGTISEDRTRGAFAVNVDGMSQIYLVDMLSREFAPVSVIPTGLAFGMEFSPDGRKLGLSLNTSKTPSDSFVLDLGKGALEYGDEREPAMRKHLQSISPLTHVDKIKIPMLVVQGENDPRVPVTEAVQVVEALRAQGQPVWYMNALNEGHGYRKKENRDVYQQASIMFLQEYLIGESQ